jgi:hypothetical protein
MSKISFEMSLGDCGTNNTPLACKGSKITCKKAIAEFLKTSVAAVGVVISANKDSCLQCAALNN